MRVPFLTFVARSSTDSRTTSTGAGFLCLHSRSLRKALRSEELGHPAAFTCPDCAGTLYEIKDGPHIRYRCRVGHAYSEDSIVEAQGASLERALWAGLRALEERSALLTRIAEHAKRRGHRALAAIFEEKSQQIEDDVRTLHEVVTNGRALDPVGHDGI